MLLRAIAMDGHLELQGFDGFHSALTSGPVGRAGLGGSLCSLSGCCGDRRSLG